MLDVLLIGSGSYGTKHYINAINDSHIRAHHNDVRITTAVDTRDRTTELPTAVDFIQAATPEKLEKKLQEEPDAAIISTPPETHKQYALWTIEKGMHTLIDKPLTTREDASTNIDQARGIRDDYDEITDAIEQARENTPDLTVHINSQKRFDHSVQKLAEVVAELPHGVTHMMGSKGDGQWRMPHELLNEEYHGYTNGTGVLSHTGYHTLDIITRVMEASDVTYEDVTIDATVDRPADILEHFTVEDHENEFGYTSQHSQHELQDRRDGYGEVNLSATLSFTGDARTTVQLQLLHHTLSERDNHETPEDLHTDSGRLDQEHYTFHAGTFGSLNLECSDPGMHMMPERSRWNSMLTGRIRTERAGQLRNITAHDNQYIGFEGVDHAIVDAKRHRSLNDFFKAIRDNEEGKNAFSTHERTVRLMSGIYESIANGYNNHDSKITRRF